MRLISFFATAVFTFLFTSLVHADYSRMIKNDTNDTWEITAEPYSKDDPVIFDGSFDDKRYERQFTACHPGSHLKNGPCILGPVFNRNNVTYIVFKHSSARGRFFFTNKDRTKKIIVDYWGTGKGVGMKSSDPSRINDNHGDITIFAGAEK